MCFGLWVLEGEEPLALLKERKWRARETIASRNRSGNRTQENMCLIQLDCHLPCLEKELVLEGLELWDNGEGG